MKKKSSSLMIGTLVFLITLSARANVDLSAFAGTWRLDLSAGCRLTPNTTLAQNDLSLEVRNNQVTWNYLEFFDYPTFEPNKIRFTKVFPDAQEFKATFVPLEVPANKPEFLYTRITHEVIRESGRLILRETVKTTSVSEHDYKNKLKNVKQVYAGSLPFTGSLSTILEADGSLKTINSTNPVGCRRVRVSSF